MLRRQNHKCCAKKRIWTRRKYLQRITGLRLKNNIGTLTPPNPVDLCTNCVVGPIKVFESLDQLIGIFSDLEKPLRQFTPGDIAMAAPIRSIGIDFLVRQRTTDGTPPLQSCGPICQATLIELQENPLCPPVIVRMARVNLTVPVI